MLSCEAMAQTTLRVFLGSTFLIVLIINIHVDVD